MAEDLGSIPSRDKRFFSSPQSLDQLWGPPSLLFNGYWQLFSRDKIISVWSWPFISCHYFDFGVPENKLYVATWLGGMLEHSWLRHYATSYKVMGSIPNKVIGFFNWPNPSSCTLALRLNQSLTKLIPEIFFGVKGGQLVHKADNFTTICEPIV
jgi:hypothetical protein